MCIYVCMYSCGLYVCEPYARPPQDRSCSEYSGRHSGVCWHNARYLWTPVRDPCTPMTDPWAPTSDLELRWEIYELHWESFGMVSLERSWRSLDSHGDLCNPVGDLWTPARDSFLGETCFLYHVLRSMRISGQCSTKRRPITLPGSVGWREAAIPHQPDTNLH